MIEPPDGPRDRLLEEAYAEMRRVARQRVHQSGIGSFQATELVSEAYLRLVDRERTWENRAELFFLAARAIHDILVEHSRKRATEKRGGKLERVEWENIVQVADKHPDSYIDLSLALEALEKEDPDHARVVIMRYIGGYSIDETAQALGISPSSVDRMIFAARAYLHPRVSRD